MIDPSAPVARVEVTLLRDGDAMCLSTGQFVGAAVISHGELTWHAFVKANGQKTDNLRVPDQTGSDDGID
jgi:hypothetical protein